MFVHLTMEEATMLRIPLTALAIGLLGLLLAGCVVEERPPGPPPTPGWHWVPGHYGPYGGWQPGHWVP